MSRRAWLWPVVVPAALVSGTAASAFVYSSDHIDLPRLQAVLIALVGGSFIAAGLIARTRRPVNRTGLLLIAVGFTWFLGGLIGTSQSLAWSIGVLVMALPAGFLIHLLLAYPSGRLQSGWERFVVVTGYALVTVGHGSHLLFESNPPNCDECPSNAFLVSEQDRVADVLTSSLQAVAVVYLLAVVGTLIGRWQRSSMAARRTLTPVFVAGGATLLLFAVSVGAQSFSWRVSDVAGWIASFVLIGVPFLFLTGLLKSRLALAETSRALAELEVGAPQEVQARVQELLHDPTAELLLSSLTDVRGFEDVKGNPRNLEDAKVGRAVTPIDREGRPLAAIVHDESLLEEPELIEQVAAAVGLKLEMDHNVFELRASERRSRALLEAIPDSMFRISRDGRILDYRVEPPIKLFRPEEGMIGSHVYDSDFPREITDRNMALGAKALDTGELQVHEYQVEINGEARDQEARITRSGSNEFLLIVRDVTERKRQEQEQAALHRVAVAVARESSTERIFDLVTEEAGRVLGAHSANLVRYEPGGEEAVIVGRWSMPGVSAGPVGERYRTEGGPAKVMYATGRPVRYELKDGNVPPTFAAQMREWGVDSLIAAPITVSGHLWGAVGASLMAPHSFPSGAEERLGAFTRLVSLALANEEAREQLAASLSELEASERRSRALLEAMPDNMFRIAADGTFLDIEETPSSGNPVHAKVGSSVYDYPGVSRELVDEVMAAGKRALETGELQTIEWKLGSEADLRYQEGRFIPSGEREFFLVVRDVTERKRQEEEQAALHRVALAVAGEARAERIFDLVTEEVGRVLGAHGANLIRYEPGGDEAVIVGGWSEPGASSEPVGERYRMQGGAAHMVYKTGRPIRFELDEGTVPPQFVEQMRNMRVNSLIAAPITVTGRPWGAVIASLTAPHSFPPGAEDRLGAFTQLVSLALANEEAREQLAASRARLVSAGDEERRRLERNLHDGAQQRLVSVSLSLRLAQARVASDPDDAAALLGGANAELAVALEELRELARGIHPAVLTERGLGPALASLADRTPLPVEFEQLPDDRLPAQVEAAAYYVVSEALANIAKYAGASYVSVRVEQRDGRAVIEVVDDGVGGADPEHGSGLRGLADRVEALEGHLAVVSPAGEGTTIRAEIPMPMSPLDALAAYVEGRGLAVPQDSSQPHS
jgi:PAS domain S-box-containing protein